MVGVVVVEEESFSFFSFIIINSSTLLTCSLSITPLMYTC